MPQFSMLNNKNYKKLRRFILFYFSLFLTKKPFSVTNSVKVCNDEEKFIVFNCFFIRIYLEREKKIIVIISLCSRAY